MQKSEKILSGILRTERVASGYIFTGNTNEARVKAAINFAKALNCMEENRPCEKCVSCLKAGKEVHPDITLIQKDKTSIKIDQIRKLKDMTKYGPSEGKHQVVILNGADTLTTEAANSFLKILEEPAQKVVFILICDRDGTLPKTIESRCQKIIFEEPKELHVSADAENLIKNISSKKYNFIEISERLSGTKDPKELLQELFTAFAAQKKKVEARKVLEILKGLQRKANAKLALELLSIKLWKTN